MLTIYIEAMMVTVSVALTLALIACQNGRGPHLVEGGRSHDEVASGCYLMQHAGHCLHCLLSTANVLPALHTLHNGPWSAHDYI